MNWESTDQFGNLYKAESHSASPADFHDDLRSMCVEVFKRRSTGVRFAIDQDMQEIAAPDPDQVTHIMNVPWFEEGNQEQFDAVAEILREVIAESGNDAVVQGPWD